MATIQNARDVYLQAESPRLLPVTISNDFTFNGNVTGTLNSVLAGKVTTRPRNGTVPACAGEDARISAHK